MVGSNQTPRTAHVLDNDRGFAWNVLSHVPRDDSRVSVEASARREPDDDTNSLTLVKRFLGKKTALES